MQRQVVNHDEQYGITDGHWNMFQQLARSTHRLILLRTGKKASLHWIAKNFPAKPIYFKSKVDADVGLLFARSPDEKHNVFEYQHFVLEPADGSKPADDVKRFRAVRRDETGEIVEQSKREYNSNEHTWATVDLIIDKESGLPFTSDYDLAAVIDPTDNRRGKMFMADVSRDSKNSLGGQNPEAGRPDFDMASPFTRPVIDTGNQLFCADNFDNPLTGQAEKGKPRLMHSPNAQYSPLAGSPVGKDGETFLVFSCFSNQVEAITCPTKAESRAALDALHTEAVAQESGG